MSLLPYLPSRWALQFSKSFCSISSSGFRNLLVELQNASCHPQHRDLDSLNELSQKLVPHLSGINIPQCLEICQLYNKLNISYDPIFSILAEHFEKAIQDTEIHCHEDFLCIAQTYATQRYQHQPLFQLLDIWLQKNQDQLLPSQWIPFFYYFSHLSILPSFDYQAMLLNKWDQFNTIQDISLFLYSLFLLDLPDPPTSLIEACLRKVTPLIFSTDNNNWTSNLDYQKIHKRLLLLRMCLRHNYTTLYRQMPELTIQAFKKINSLPEPLWATPKSSFVYKFSERLNKLRINHSTYINKGPVMIDIIENHSKIAWFCNSYHRFYVGSQEKLATVRLKEKLVTQLGYNVAQCQFWQWNKMKSKRTRIEFIRMARYAALKDQREYDPTSEHWHLPYVSKMHPKTPSLHVDGYYYPNDPQTSSHGEF